MESCDDVKVRGTLGEEMGGWNTITILNVTLDWTQEWLVYKADGKHA